MLASLVSIAISHHGIGQFVQVFGPIWPNFAWSATCQVGSLSLVPPAVVLGVAPDDLAVVNVSF